MADIQALCGLRYDLAKVGSLSSVVAPPCDAIDPAARDRLYELSPYNVVRLTLNRGDDVAVDEIPQQVAWQLKRWRRDEILKADQRACVYVYHQTFTLGGVERTRRGFMARVKLQELGGSSGGSGSDGSGVAGEISSGSEPADIGPQIYGHEQTYSGPMLDRLALMEACNCNLSQIFAVYADPQHAIQNLLEAGIADRTPLVVEQTDPLGEQLSCTDLVRHEMWLVDDPTVIAAAAQQMGPKSLWIADGHHRYTAALELLRRCKSAAAARGETWDPEHPANYTLMMCVSQSDPGLQVFATHRILSCNRPLDLTQLTERLSPYFECQAIEPSGSSTSAKDAVREQAHSAWELLQLEGDPTTLAFACGGNGGTAWLCASLTSAGEGRLRATFEGTAGSSEDSAGGTTGSSEGLRSLSVSVLHGLAAELLEASDERPQYFASAQDLGTALAAGESYQVGCLLLPVTPNQIAELCTGGELLPPKSSFFWPKLLSGLVLNPLK